MAVHDDPSGRRDRITVTADHSGIIRVMRAALRFALFVFLFHPLQGQSLWLRDADDGARVVIETGVTCDILPGDRTPIPFGMPIRSATEVKRSGETFFLGYPAMAPNSRCRFFGPST